MSGSATRRRGEDGGTRRPRKTRLIQRIHRLCGMWRKRTSQKLGECSQRRGSTLQHSLLAWWQWQTGLWRIVDVRTLWLVSIVHSAFTVAYGVHEVVHVLSHDSVSRELVVGVSDVVYRVCTMLLCSIGEGVLVKRALRIESRTDLIAAALLSLLLAGCTLSEALLTASTVLTSVRPPPLWVAIPIATLSAAFTYLICLIFSQFGWRRFMLFGDEPERLALFDGLLAFHSLEVLQVLVSLDQCVSVAHALISCHDACYGGVPWYDDLRGYVGLIAAPFNLANELLLRWAVRRESVMGTCASASFGVFVQAWLVYFSASSALELDRLLASTASSASRDAGTNLTSVALHRPSSLLAQYQLGVAAFGMLVRVTVSVLSVWVLRHVYHTGLKLHEEVSRDAKLPERWRALPDDRRAALEQLLVGHVCDLVLVRVGIASASSPAPFHAATPSQALDPLPAVST